MLLRRRRRAAGRRRPACLAVPPASPCRLPARLPTASHGGSPAPSTLGGSPACLPCLLRSASPRALVLRRPMPKPAPTTAPRRSAAARRATASRAACLPALSCRFATLGDAPAVSATICTLPRRPDPATNEPTRRPLAATGCPASPPPRRCLAATCTCLPPVCRRRVLSLPSLLLPFLLLLACRLRKRPLLLKMPSSLPQIYLPAGLLPWPPWPPKLSLLLLASGASCSIAPSWLAHPQRYAAASFAKFRASSRRLKPSERKQRPRAARLCAASRHNAGAAGRGWKSCKAVLSCFTRERLVHGWSFCVRG